MSARPLRITVVGGNRCDEATASLAERVGRGIARRGGVLVCGGLGGVMEAACRGAASEGGITVGILPGPNASDANEHVTIPIPTGIGYARNVVNVLAGDAIIALEGSHGTMSEIEHALGFGIPVVAVDSWSHVDGVERTSDPDDAVAKAFELAGERRG